MDPTIPGVSLMQTTDEAHGQLVPVKVYLDLTLAPSLFHRVRG